MAARKDMYALPRSARCSWVRQVVGNADWLHQTNEKQQKEIGRSSSKWLDIEHNKVVPKDPVHIIPPSGPASSPIPDHQMPLPTYSFFSPSFTKHLLNLAHASKFEFWSTGNNVPLPGTFSPIISSSSSFAHPSFSCREELWKPSGHPSSVLRQLLRRQDQKQSGSDPASSCQMLWMQWR